jgi:plastocyanin
MKTILMLFALGACGDDGGTTVQSDAPVTSGTTVQTVDCASNAPATTVSTQNFMFAPAAVTINSGQVVKFILEDAHDLAPDSGAGSTDAGLTAATGATACLKFTATGTFHYECGIHNSMKGTVTVQ